MSDERASESAAQALARARGHARRAAGEALAALRALADAASLGWTGRPSEAHAALRGFSQLLDEQSRRLLEGHGTIPAPVIHAILDALDHEIGRWEKRAERDPDARAVLRTFLGLREILWEFGFQRGVAHPSEPPDDAAAFDERAPGVGAAARTAKASSDGDREAPRADGTRPRKSRPESRRATGRAAPKRRSRVQRVDVKG